MIDNNALTDEPQEKVRVGTKEEMRKYFLGRTLVSRRMNSLAVALIVLAMAVCAILLTSCAQETSGPETEEEETIAAIENTNNTSESESTQAQSAGEAQTSSTEGTSDTDSDGADGSFASEIIENGEVIITLTNTQGSGFYWTYTASQEDILDEVSNTVEGDTTVFQFKPANPGGVMLMFSLTERGHSEEAMAQVTYVFNVDQSLNVTQESKDTGQSAMEQAYDLAEAAMG